MAKRQKNPLNFFINNFIIKMINQNVTNLEGKKTELLTQVKDIKKTFDSKHNRIVDDNTSKDFEKYTIPSSKPTNSIKLKIFTKFIQHCVGEKKNINFKHFNEFHNDFVYDDFLRCTIFVKELNPATINTIKKFFEQQLKPTFSKIKNSVCSKTAEGIANMYYGINISFELDKKNKICFEVQIHNKNTIKTVTNNHIFYKNYVRLKLRDNLKDYCDDKGQTLNNESIETIINKFDDSKQIFNDIKTKTVKDTIDSMLSNAKEVDTTQEEEEELLKAFGCKSRIPKIDFIDRIDTDISWLSDHPLIHLTDINNNKLKLGVFNVLSYEKGSSLGKNSHLSDEPTMLKLYLELLKLLDIYKNNISPESLNQTALINLFDEKDTENFNLIKKDHTINLNETELKGIILKFKKALVDLNGNIDSFDDIDNIITILKETTIKSKINAYFIDTLLCTKKFAGFKYTENPIGIKITDDSYKYSKIIFLRKQILNFFKDVNDGILVCPEFDWEDLLYPETTQSLKREIGYFKFNTDIKYIKCGSHKLNTRDTKHNKIVKSNYEMVVFYKSTEKTPNIDTEFISLEFTFDGTLEYCSLDKLTIGENIIYALHGKSIESLKDFEKKNAELKQIYKAIQKNTDAPSQPIYLMGDFNYPMTDDSEKLSEYGKYITSTPIEIKGQTFKIVPALNSNGEPFPKLGNMKKIRVLSLTNAQIHKAQSETEIRDYGTDYICKLLPETETTKIKTFMTQEIEVTDVAKKLKTKENKVTDVAKKLKTKVQKITELKYPDGTTYPYFASETEGVIKTKLQYDNWILAGGSLNSRKSYNLFKNNKKTKKHTKRKTKRETKKKNKRKNKRKTKKKNKRKTKRKTIKK